MRDGAGGLEEHEGVVGRGEVGAAGAVVIGEGADIEEGVVAAEGEFESVLAVFRSVAGAGAATTGGDDGGDVGDPIGFDVLGESGDGDFGVGGGLAEGGGDVVWIEIDVEPTPTSWESMDASISEVGWCLTPPVPLAWDLSELELFSSYDWRAR